MAEAKTGYKGVPTRMGGKRVAPDVALPNNKGSDGGGESEVAKAARSIYDKARSAPTNRRGGGDDAMHKR